MVGCGAGVVVLHAAVMATLQMAIAAMVLMAYFMTAPKKKPASVGLGGFKEKKGLRFDDALGYQAMFGNDGGFAQFARFRVVFL